MLSRTTANSGTKLAEPGPSVFHEYRLACRFDNEKIKKLILDAFVGNALVEKTGHRASLQTIWT
jgi:hypothetical protein